MISGRRMPTCVFYDNAESNFSDQSICPRVVTFLVKSMSDTKLETYNMKAGVREKQLQKLIKNTSLSTGDLVDFADIDQNAGLRSKDIKNLQTLVDNQLVTHVVLDFDRTLSVFEGFPANEGRCYSRFGSMLNKLGIKCSILQASTIILGGNKRVKLLQKLWRCPVHIMVLTNNPCAALICDILESAGIQKPNVVSTFRKGMSKFQVIANTYPELKQNKHVNIELIRTYLETK
jgi:hypothetical protein